MRLWLRRILTPLLGLVFAASMSVSAVQAAEMASKMVAAPTVDVAQHSKCPDCNQKSGGMKAMTCGVAVCAAQAIAALPETVAAVAFVDGLDLPNSRQPSLVGLARAPEPGPPRL